MPKTLPYSTSVSGSGPAIDCSVIAASATVLVIGPAVSCDAEIGAMP